VPVLIVIN